MIDGPPRPEEFGDKLARQVVSEDYPVFAHTKARESRKIFIQGRHVAPLAGIHFVKGTANVPPNTRMQRPESVNDLVREPQAGTSSEST